MRRSTLLLVEDSKEVLEDNRKALVAAGYEVLAASTLAGARERLARRQPDLILLDVLLPDGNGVELCRELRDSTAAPILFLTSLGESEQIVEGLRAGGDDYLAKPYDLEVLVAGHHGSKSSTSKELLEALTPETGIISVGDNSYGHPTEDALRRLVLADVEIYRTDKQGTVHLSVN